MIFRQLLMGVVYFLRLIQGLLIVYCILSLFMRPNNRLVRILGRAMEPCLVPVRRVMLRLTQNPYLLGFAPLILSFLIDLLISLLINASYYIL